MGQPLKILTIPDKVSIKKMIMSFRNMRRKSEDPGNDKSFQFIGTGVWTKNKMIMVSKTADGSQTKDR